MSFSLFKNFTDKVLIYKSYIGPTDVIYRTNRCHIYRYVATGFDILYIGPTYVIYIDMCQQDLISNNPQRLIYHKIQPTIYIYIYIYIYMSYIGPTDVIYIDMCQQDLISNNPQRLICHKIQPTIHFLKYHIGEY